MQSGIKILGSLHYFHYSGKLTFRASVLFTKSSLLEVRRKQCLIFCRKEQQHVIASCSYNQISSQATSSVGITPTALRKLYCHYPQFSCQPNKMNFARSNTGWGLTAYCNPNSKLEEGTHRPPTGFASSTFLIRQLLDYHF